MRRPHGRVKAERAEEELKQREAKTRRKAAKRKRGWKLKSSKSVRKKKENGKNPPRLVLSGMVRASIATNRPVSSGTKSRTTRIPTGTMARSLLTTVLSPYSTEHLRYVPVDD